MFSKPLLLPHPHNIDIMWFLHFADNSDFTRNLVDVESGIMTGIHTKLCLYCCQKFLKYNG